MLVRSKRVPVLAAALVIAVVLLGATIALVAGVGEDDAGNAAPAADGVTRRALGRADPANAPGQRLYLEEVTIAPGTRLGDHFHEGTQVAQVVSGVLTYNIVSGTATVNRANGEIQEASGPGQVLLAAGDTVTEAAGLVHFGANDTDRPVVIVLAALLAEEAPLATPVGGGTGTAIHLTADLESEARTLHAAGPGGAVVYGWNHLRATSTLEGQPVGVEMLGSVDYEHGNGPFSGFVTFSFADGSTLAVAMEGLTRAAPDTGDATFAATLGVIGGTGRYVSATGTGTFVGSRTAALGTAVAATFDLTVAGAT